ncbi:MAG: aminotransferase class I/II-fold pyridoxal phosphate-dependent enzyme [Firmicutes bacterium]|nr:aminotransferase class I/II-fold pyridoxal phosphate-dependent enzyme [Bacillota bacterium]
MESVLSLLERYCGDYIPMCMPGHKRNLSLPHAEYLSHLAAGIDVTECAGLDNLNSPAGIFLESERTAASLWGARRSLYLVNGSTGGILAAVYAMVSAGDEVICARACHRSVYSALEITGAVPTFVDSLPDGSVSAGAVKAALQNHPKARLVIITSPTYDGVICDVEKIADVCRLFGARLFVDEAHGAHFGLCGGIFGKSAISLGADVSVDSLHKTLPSLTGTAIMHIGEGAGAELSARLEAAAAMFMTSSPSYILSASIDGCVRLLSEHGSEIIPAWHALCEKFYERCESLSAVRLLPPDGRDISKLVFDTSGTDMTGADFAALLREKYHIEPEAASPDTVLAMTGAGDTERTLEALLFAVSEIDAAATPRAGGARFPKNPPTPKRAALASDVKKSGAPCEAVALTRACGRVSGEYIWAYPPGVPIIIPGEIFDDEIISFINETTAKKIELFSNFGGLISPSATVSCIKSDFFA